MSRSKQKGTTFETSLLPVLREYYPGTERRALSGAKDKGDFILPGAPFALEAKNVKAMSLGSWVDEAEVEAANLGVRYGVVAHKRRGVTDPARQFVTMSMGQFLELVAGR
jgi:hypothetical protein